MSLLPGYLDFFLGEVEAIAAVPGIFVVKELVLHEISDSDYLVLFILCILQCLRSGCLFYVKDVHLISKCSCK